jgi:arylsulfatase A-like enzyme
MNTTRRQFLAATATGAAVLPVVACATVPVSSGERPNILWIVSEDNFPYLGAYGDPLARTPNVDALAAGGILYRHAYANAPVCAPSRFAMLTGLFPESCAPANHMRANARVAGLVPTWPELLRGAGYYVTNNAKTDWNCDVDPAVAFDESSDTAHWRNRPAGAPFAAMVTLMISHESQIFQPVAGAVTPGQVHVPAYLPDAPRTRQDIASYYNRLQQMDSQLGALLAELEAAGLAEDTIVVHSSDNGGVFGRSKRHCYEDGLHCSLIVRVPAKWAHLAPQGPGSVVDSPVNFVDLPATFVSLAGLPVPATMQGQALMGPAAQGPQQWAFGMRNRMDERYDMVRTVSDGRWRYVRNYMPYLPSGQYQAFAWQAGGYQEWETLYLAGQLNDAQAKFFRPRPFEELFDVTSDPDQLTNLADAPEQSGRMETMRAALDAHMLAVTDNGFIPEGSPLEGLVGSRVAGAYPLARAMDLAATAARRDPAGRPVLEAALAEPNEVLRYWGALGLAMLGDCEDAVARLREMIATDLSPQVRVVAAEALLRDGHTEEAVATLIRILSGDQSDRVKLAAVNVLTRAGEAARPAIPQLQAATQAVDEYLPNAAIYCLQQLDGTFDPNRPFFDFNRIQENARRAGIQP